MIDQESIRQMQSEAKRCASSALRRVEAKIRRIDEIERACRAYGTDVPEEVRVVKLKLQDAACVISHFVVELRYDRLGPNSLQLTQQEIQKIEDQTVEPYLEWKWRSNQR